MSFIVFIYETLKESERAIQVAQEVYDLAKQKLKELPDYEYRSAMVEIELQMEDLGNNIQLWKDEEYNKT